MALIDRYAAPISDSWQYQATEDIKLQSGLVVEWPVLAAAFSSGSVPNRIGVFMDPTTPLDEIVPQLAAISLVVVRFPKFRDGRGFTIARTLRDRYFFPGEIRAAGQILPDQFTALISCGFTTILTPAAHPPDQWGAQVAAPRAGTGQLLNRLVSRRGGA